MVLLPPRVRCSYPSDQSLGVTAAHDEHLASFWIGILAIFAIFLTPALLVATGWGENAERFRRKRAWKREHWVVSALVGAIAVSVGGAVGMAAGGASVSFVVVLVGFMIALAAGLALDAR
jgi:hypothetical protein